MVLTLSLFAIVSTFAIVNTGMGMMFVLITFRHSWISQPTTQTFSLFFGLLTMGAGLYLHLWSIMFLLANTLP